MDTLTTTPGMRQQWRRLAAVLQFLDHLIDAGDVPTLVRALVHAVAVWLDADARIYRRDAGGDYVLHTSLPGVDVPERARRVRRSVIAQALTAGRALSPSDFGEAIAGAVYVFPLATSGESEWLLAICAPLDTVDDPVMTVVARVAGMRLEALDVASRDRLHERLLAALQIDSRGADAAAAEALGVILAETGGQVASLWLEEGGALRRLASAGPEPATPRVAPTVPAFLSNRCTLRLTLGGESTAWLEVAAMEGEQLRLGSARLLQQAARVLQPWLSGTSGAARRATGTASAEELRAFAARLEEELARARRFNLRLSLLLVDLGQEAGEGSVVARLQTELRRELRGSDVLGRMQPHQLAALLIETDAEGTGAVAHRLKRRLLDAAESMNLTSITIGHAALSPTCHTADALVGQARRHAEPVIKH